jgi:hypothetical protein
MLSQVSPVQAQPTFLNSLLPSETVEFVQALTPKPLINVLSRLFLVLLNYLKKLNKLQNILLVKSLLLMALLWLHLILWMNKTLILLFKALFYRPKKELVKLLLLVLVILHLKSKWILIIPIINLLITPLKIIKKSKTIFELLFKKKKKKNLLLNEFTIF